MRILIAHSFYRNPGGEDRYVREQLALLARHYSVDLLAEDNRNLRRSLSTAARMTFSRTKTREILSRIESFRPDVIHIHNVYPSLGPSVHLAAKKARVGVVMTVHNFRLRCPNGLMFTEDAICRRCQGGMYQNAVIHECFPSRRQALAYAEALWLHRFILRLEQRVALFLTPSLFMKEKAVEWGLDRERIRLVRHFVIPHEGVSPAAGTYGMYAGRLSSEKGLDNLLQALRLAGDPPFRLLGDGPLESRIRALAKHLSLTNLQILGRRPADETSRVMSEARFVVLPSVSQEVAPLSALEAMSLARPVLVSEVGALPEIAEGAGLIAKAQDPKDLAAKISQLFDDDDLCMKLGQAGWESSRTNYSPESHLTALQAAYSDVLQSHPPGSYDRSY